MVPVGEPRLGPPLDLKLLSQSGEIKYGGNGRKIFVGGCVPMEKPKANGTDKQAGLRLPPPIQPHPPITLKVFGFANRRGATKQVFLTPAEALLMPAPSEIVNPSYRILRTTPSDVRLQDRDSDH